MSTSLDARPHSAATTHPAIEFVLWLVWRALALGAELVTVARMTADTASAFVTSRQHAPQITGVAVVLLLSAIPAIVGR